jgi:basic membrane protein A
MTKDNINQSSTGSNIYSRRNLLRTASTGLFAGLAGCSGRGTTSNSDTVTAAFVYDDVAEGVSFINSHERARKEIEERYEWIETQQSYQVDVEGSEAVFRRYAQEGVDIVFGNTFGYQDIMAELSQEFTDVRWENCAGFRTTDNLGIFYTNQEEIRYVLGKAAAMLMDEGQSLGYIGSFPISLTKRNINALTLGARSVNPEIKTIPQFVNTWYDPPKEQQATESLSESGVGSVFQVTDSAAPPKAADKLGIFGTGMWGSMREAGGDNYLSGVVCNWTPHYDQKLNAIRNDQWESEFVWGGFAENMIELDEFGPKVTDEVKTTIEDTKQKITDDEISIWQGSEFEDVDPREEIYAGTDNFVDGVNV